jgi:hypothetical protein
MRAALKPRKSLIGAEGTMMRQPISRDVMKTKGTAQREGEKCHAQMSYKPFHVAKSISNFGLYQPYQPYQHRKPARRPHSFSWRVSTAGRNKCGAYATTHITNLIANKPFLSA